MATSAPLLISRAKQGLGPCVPLRAPARVVVVEGLSILDTIRIYVIGDGEAEFLDFKEGETYLDDPIPAGRVLRAELLGQDSYVSVWVE